MCNRGVVVVLIVTIFLAGSGGIAEAELEERSANANSGNGSAEANAQIETVQDRGPGERGKRRRGGSLSCSYYSPVGISNSGDGRGVQGNQGYGTAAEVREAGFDSYGIICKDGNGQEVVNDIRGFDERGGAPEVDAEVLADQAAARLAVSPPQVELSPKVGLNQITQLATYMWVTNWEPDSTSASVPGVTSTVTATPTKVTWDMGNGDQVVCNGPGTPFDFSRPEDSQTTDCTYTYRHSSTGQPGGVYQVSATMSYDVSWSAEGAPGGGALPAVSATESFPVRVIEIHAVEGVGTGAG